MNEEQKQKFARAIRDAMAQCNVLGEISADTDGKQWSIDTTTGEPYVSGVFPGELTQQEVDELVKAWLESKNN